ncbi:cytochrome P450 2K6-like [Candoia aspera]|uniref:cytochrome P450 2K6-like n=1 Tax=Candoia aspera TaxID=51853 RepID=UPI002FD80100
MDWIGLVLTLLLCLLAITSLLKKGSHWNNSSANLPPGPRTIPILGNLHRMDLKRPYRTMIQVKPGIVFAHGENWKVMRRFTLATLRDYGMGRRTIEDKIIEECGVLAKTIETYAGKSFGVTTIMTAAVSNIIVSILFGKRYVYEDATFLRLLKLMRENVQLSATPVVLIYNVFSMLGLLLGSHKTVMNNRKELHDFIQTTFIERLKDLDENDRRSFIDSFLVRQREENMKMTNGKYFHNENLKALISDLFGAGTETSANSLLWAILLMMKHPEIQRKVQEEIAKVIGDLQPRTDHRARMPYTDAVIREVHRFADIVPTNVPHATTRDIAFKGFFIPRGMHIAPLLTSVLHDESQWEKPHEFYPEHFLDSEGKFAKNAAFLPFSAGWRACAGENLAKMELVLFFTSLLQRFTFQPPPGTSKDDLNLTPAVGFTAPPMLYKTCAVLH